MKEKHKSLKTMRIKKSPLIYHGVMLMKTEKRSTPLASGGRCVINKCKLKL